jgi:hypothetical protein
MGLGDLRNRLDYAARQRLRLRPRGRKPVRRRAEAKDGLYDHLPPAERDRAEARAAELLAGYRLHALHGSSDRRNYRENLYYLDLLERCLGASGADLPAAVRAVDIGVSHWFYVQALYAALRWWRCPSGRQVALTGHEVDAWRLHVDLRPRHDHALAHIGEMPEVRYVPEGFTAQPGSFDWVSLLFPFVFPRDHVRWGLPRRLFSPDALLAAAWASVAPGGLMVIVNQGEAEHAAQRAMLEAANIAPAAAFQHESPLYQYRLSRWILIARR